MYNVYPSFSEKLKSKSISFVLSAPFHKASFKGSIFILKKGPKNTLKTIFSFYPPPPFLIGVGVWGESMELVPAKVFDINVRPNDTYISNLTLCR